MKKLSLIILCFFIFTLSACKEKENKLFDITYDIYTPADLLFVTEKETFSQNETVICYSVTNISNEQSCIAADEGCFELHRIVNGEWKRVGFKNDVMYNNLGLILEPGQKEERKIELDNYFNLPLEAGQYRIAIEGIVSNTFEITE